MDLLAFKVIVAPLLLAAARIASRRWGEAIGGLLVGLPLTSGPIPVFLALEHGPAFAEQATSGSLAATAAQAGFCVVYCQLARYGWPTALAVACAAFAAAAALLDLSNLPSWELFVVAILAIGAALRLISKDPVQAARFALPWWDLPARMALISGLVVGVTLVAPYVGPSVSGVLASFPLMATILAAFAHRTTGPVAARQVMRGMVAGLLGFSAFFYVLSLTLTRASLPVAFGGALACALVVQAFAWQRLRQAIPPH